MINYFNAIVRETRTNTQIYMTIQFTWFHGTNTVRVNGWNGERWNCNVTAPPPLTSTSNLYGKQWKKKYAQFDAKMEKKCNRKKKNVFVCCSTMKIAWKRSFKCRWKTCIEQCDSNQCTILSLCEWMSVCRISAEKKSFILCHSLDEFQ